MVFQSLVKLRGFDVGGIYFVQDIFSSSTVHVYTFFGSHLSISDGSNSIDKYNPEQIRVS